MQAVIHIVLEVEGNFENIEDISKPSGDIMNILKDNIKKETVGVEILSYTIKEKFGL